MDFETRGILYIWNGRVMFATNSMQTDFHAHYAATLAISLKGNIAIETNHGREEYRAALVGPNTFHRTVSPGTEMIALLIDPETYEYGWLADSVTPGAVKRLEVKTFQSLTERMLALYSGILSNTEAYELQLDMLGSVQPFQRLERKVDERIQTIARRIRTELPDSIRIKEIGADLSISEDHLIRLFKESLGIPLRRYLLWVRLLKATRLLKEGISLTEAAHAAGFSDSAHFTRTFKENFGFVPSIFFGHLKAIEVRFCEPDD